MSPGTLKRVLLALLDSDGSGTGVGGDGQPHTSRAETARSPQQQAHEPPGKERGRVGERRGRHTTEEDWVDTALCSRGG